MIMGMSLLKIARMGHPVLRKVAAPFPDPTAASLGWLVDDMRDTMIDAGGVGLAAPQVHISRRMVIVRLPRDQSEGGPLSGETVLINPEIEPIGDEMELGWEGCLSVPGMRGLVPRHKHIRYCSMTPDGEQLVREVSGFHARVIQHEVDHLDGILYLDRMPDLRYLIFNEEMRYYDGKVGHPGGVDTKSNPEEEEGNAETV